VLHILGMLLASKWPENAPPPRPAMHTCLLVPISTAHTYEKFHCLLHKRLDAILQSVQPAKSVMLAIDGPAPLAKVLTQRERRKVTMMQGR